MNRFLLGNIRAVFFGFFFLLGFLSPVPKEAVAGVTTNAVLLTSATVPSNLTLNLEIIDETTQAAVPTMNFGDLERVGNEFRSTKLFRILLNVDTVGDPLVVTQIGSPLVRTGGFEIIPSGAYIVEPTYSEEDNNGKTLPGTAIVGARTSVVGTHETYSDTAGSKRTVSIFYRLSGDPATGGTEIIPLDQKSGAYTGTVQFTLVSG